MSCYPFATITDINLISSAFYHFIPPVRLCLDPGCNSKSRTAKQAGVPYSCELAEMISVPVTAFTQDFGPIPALSTSLYCRGGYSLVVCYLPANLMSLLQNARPVITPTIGSTRRNRRELIIRLLPILFKLLNMFLSRSEHLNSLRR